MRSTRAYPFQIKEKNITNNEVRENKNTKNFVVPDIIIFPLTERFTTSVYTLGDLVS